MLAREIAERLRSAAEPIYGAAEADSIKRLLLEQMWGITTSRRAMEPNCDYEAGDLERIIHDLGAARPVQYIIGHTEFCGIDLTVREGVLIPRPETEELIDWCVELLKNITAPRVADICTGSGAIAISIAKRGEPYQITALDISPAALEICRENITKNSVNIELIEGDALHGVEHYLEGEYDMIVSNPPYIPISEMALMRANVTQHEPHIALFVEDEDPLIFYRTIATSAQKLLRSGGVLLYEIHENFAEQTIAMLNELGYINIELRCDIFNKPRMICAQRE